MTTFLVSISIYLFFIPIQALRILPYFREFDEEGNINDGKQAIYTAYIWPLLFFFRIWNKVFGKKINPQAEEMKKQYQDINLKNK